MVDYNLQITSQDVPTFNCLVHIAKIPEGVRARVANLEGIELTAADERTALSKIVPAFKSFVKQHHEEKTAIPWIEPPLEARNDEQTRFIPVHL